MLKKYYALPLPSKIAIPCSVIIFIIPIDVTKYIQCILRAKRLFGTDNYLALHLFCMCYSRKRNLSDEWCY